MLPIQNKNVSCIDDRWIATCECGKASWFATKHAALLMVERKSCRSCSKDYRSTKNKSIGIHKNTEGKWCSICSGCKKEQAYTRMDHAKQSTVGDWRCKKCARSAGLFDSNKHIGRLQSQYRKFQKSANNRSLEWDLSLEDFSLLFKGKCALTGWDITLDHSKITASLDRIDSTKGYKKDNVRWVHVMVNMCKNKYDEKKFVEMCCAVVANQTNSEKW